MPDAGRPANSLKLEDTMYTVPESDSMGHLLIIATVDSVLHIKTTDVDLRESKSSGGVGGGLERRNALED